VRFHESTLASRQIDRFSRFRTAHGSKSLYFKMGAPFPNIVPSHGEVWIPSRPNTIFVPIRAHNPNGISIGSAVFAQMTAECPIVYCGTPISLSKLPIPMGDLDPHCSRGPPESSTQTASRSVHPFLQGSLV